MLYTSMQCYFFGSEKPAAHFCVFLTFEAYLNILSDGYHCPSLTPGGEGTLPCWAIRDVPRFGVSFSAKIPEPG